MPKKVNKYKCKNCGKEFTPYNSLTKGCSNSCNYTLAIKAVKEKREREEREWQKRKKKMKADDKSLSEYEKDLEKVINSIVRKIDYGSGCISCGTIILNSQRGFNKNEAGHFHSVGANKSTRYNLHNIHLQDTKCNKHKSANTIKYIEGLTSRYGKNYMEFVMYELNKTPLIKLTKPQLTEYTTKARYLLKSIDNKLRTPEESIKLRNKINKELNIYENFSIYQF